MKTVILICDGMDEDPLEALGGVSPRQFASRSGFRTVFGHGVTGRLLTVPAGFDPGSEVAVLSILGYRPSELPQGRAALEALGAGVVFPQGNVAFRCNFVRYTSGGGLIPSVSLSPARRRLLLEALAPLGIVAGTGDVGLLSVPFAEGMYMGCSPYAWTPGTPASALPEIAYRAANILREYRSDGLSDCSPEGIWIWSGARVRQFRTFPRKAAIISAVPLVKGIGHAIGMKVVDVDGATGDCNTDYSAKTAAALSALRESEVVVIHVEACDEASHRQSLSDKLRAISEIDEKIISSILNVIQDRSDLTLAVLSDHHTSSSTGRHGSAPVEFAVYPPRHIHHLASETHFPPAHRFISYLLCSSR